MFKNRSKKKEIIQVKTDKLYMFLLINFNFLLALFLFLNYKTHAK